MSEKEILGICQSVDDFIADYLCESIVTGKSYDMLEAHYGVLPISRRSFYRKRRSVFLIMQQREIKYIEEKNGQYEMVFDRED